MCEGKIEKFIPKNTVWHHEACSHDPEGLIFLSQPHTIIDYFSSLPFNLTEVSEYAEMWHNMI